MLRFLKSVGGAIFTGVKAVGRAIDSGVRAASRVIASGVRAASRVIVSGARSVRRFVAMEPTLIFQGVFGTLLLWNNPNIFSWYSRLSLLSRIFIGAGSVALAGGMLLQVPFIANSAIGQRVIHGLRSAFNWYTRLPVFTKVMVATTLSLGVGASVFLTGMSLLSFSGVAGILASILGNTASTTIAGAMCLTSGVIVGASTYHNLYEHTILREELREAQLEERRFELLAQQYQLMLQRQEGLVEEIQDLNERVDRGRVRNERLDRGVGNTYNFFASYPNGPIEISENEMELSEINSNTLLLTN